MADSATHMSSLRPLLPQAVAEAVLFALSLPGDQSGYPHDATAARISDSTAGAGKLTGHAKDVAQKPAGALDQAQKPLNSYPNPAVPNVLPSLLQYVDSHLMRKAAEHNRPPGYHAACNICYKPWNAPADYSYFASVPITTRDQEPVITFLPLEPCGHWVHYTCFIWHATRSQDGQDKCTACGLQLFQWEGITALTLATRTNLNIDTMMNGALLQPGLCFTKTSDVAEYEKECETIESIIHAHFFVHMKKPSVNSDSSPDLVQCFYDVLSALQRMGRPQSKWLRFTTQTGFVLWCALVAIKMRRYLVMGHNKIQTTEAWTQLEDMRRTLQSSILEEVHK